METLFTDGALRIERLIVGPLENNVYVVSNRDDAVIIDAADEAHRILSAVDGLNVSSIVTTHGHFDHVGAVREVAASLGAPFRLHQADAELAGIEPGLPLTDEEIILIGDQPLIAMHTPGHTPGSMSFLIGEQLFTGDTLFPGGPGATRFPYADFDTIMQSLDERLFVLGDSTVVYPGHGMTTTLATERPHLEEWRARRW